MAEPGKLLFVTPKSERKLRQLVGAPNTTDYGSDGTADTPQQSIARANTNPDTESSDYNGMLHLGTETEGEGENAKTYLTVDWPESGSQDKTLVGIYRNKEIYYNTKIQLTESTNIYFDAKWLYIQTANPARQTIGTYWKQIGKYSKENGIISQLWRDDREGVGGLYDGYTGMLHCYITVSGSWSGDTMTEEKLSMGIDWPESGSDDETLVGVYGNEEIHWNNGGAGTIQLDSDMLIAYDPVNNMIRAVFSGRPFASNWKIIARYDHEEKSVSQLWRDDREGDGGLYDGYDGEFTISFNPDYVSIRNGLSGSNLIAGRVSVNNVYYSVPDFVYSPAGKTDQAYFFIRHRVAQSASSGDEDPDLTEEQKNELRLTIANCDSAIATMNAAILQYSTQIDALLDQRVTAYDAIDNAVDIRNAALLTEKNRHTTAVNAENADYNQKVSAENTLNQNNAATLESTYNAGVATENRTHQDNLNKLDPSASDYDQKVAAENARHSQKLADLLNTYNTGVTAENTRHDAKLQELLTAHNAAIAAENTTNTTNTNTINETMRTAVSAQQTIISGLDNQIAAVRVSIRSQQANINDQTQRKNAACLQLYGVIPASAGCEIVALPNMQNTAQTDQYLYIYLGALRRASKTINGMDVDYINLDQAYQGAIMAFYRISSACAGLI